MENSMDYKKLYFLEDYLFNDVRKKFHEDKKLNAFDFFCIIIWKANRAKTKHAKRIKKISGKQDFNEICEEITNSVYLKNPSEEKLKYLLEKWGFRLPTASAILTVLYPDDFTIYDSRVCDTLTEFENIGNRADTDRIVNDYFDFVKRVEEIVPTETSLRDKDRYLWGKSFYTDLRESIKKEFEKDLIK